MNRQVTQNGVSSGKQTDIFTAYYLWAVVRRIEAARYPNPLDTLKAVFGEASQPNLPPDQELRRCGVDLCVLDRELTYGLDAKLFTRALRCGVLDVQSFNNVPHHRQNRTEFYQAMRAMVERVEQKMARRTRLAAAIRAQQERAAANRSLTWLDEQI